MSRPKGCTCSRCVGACERTPGIFKPGEAEKAAALIGKPLSEMIGNEIVIDYWIGREGGNVLYYRPRKEGDETDADGLVSFGSAFEQGRCAFLDDSNRCRIHAAKPFECRASFSCREQPSRTHKEQAVAAWRKAGNPLKRPVPEPTIGDVLASTFTHLSNIVTARRSEPKGGTP